MGIQNQDGSDLVGNLKEEIKFLREEISSKRLITKILAENINSHKNLKSNSNLNLISNSLYNDFIYGNNITKSKSCSNNLSNTPEMDFNITKSFVENKDVCSK